VRINIGQCHFLSRHRDLATVAAGLNSSGAARRSRARRRLDQPVITRFTPSAFAFLVRLDIEGDALSLVELFEPGLLDGGDVYEHIACPVIRLDEAVATLALKNLTVPAMASGNSYPPPAPTARRLGRTFASGRNRPVTASVTPPAPTGGGTSKPIRKGNPILPCGTVANQ